MLTEPAWFFPPLTVSRSLDSSNALSVSYVGAEIFHGQAVQHLHITSAAINVSPQIQALSQAELYLDTVTLLPAGLTYIGHPDSTISIDIPFEVLFSSYQAIGGLTFPTHVQQFRNNTIILDLQITGAKLNSGLSISGHAAAESAEVLK